MKVVIAQCTSKKRDKAAFAKELYDPSDYFEKQRDYAELADEWWVQSAKYGLVHPNQTMEPYDLHAKDVDDPNQWAWNIAVTIGRKYNPNETAIEILGGKTYADPLVPELERRGFEVHEPLRGLKIGERMAKLKRLTNKRLEVYQ